MKCSKCGAELSDDSRFCSYCGHKIEGTPPTVEEDDISDIPLEDKVSEEKVRSSKPDTPKSPADKIKDKGIETWNNLSLYGKAASVSIAFFVVLCLIALLSGSKVSVAVAIIQIAFAAISVLIHKGVLKPEQNDLQLKWLILAIAVLFTGVYVFSYSWGAEAPITEQPVSKSEFVPSTITKGTEYAYMTDEWDVYIATAISSDIIKIENWNKTTSNSKSVSHDYDVGTFRISDSENGFAWVDDEHTAFVITLKDKNNSKFKKGGTATFTINISDSNKNKGSDYSDKIACYSYQNDDWHLYRAIPLTETLIKIETWCRSSSVGTFLFGYDLSLIDTTSGDTDFEWTDNEHTSFSITMRDEENKYEWKKETFVVFILENEDYTYFDVKSYLGNRLIGEGEAAVPASANDYKHDDYRDVQMDLEDAGFSNIRTEILYDIVWGWTNEGEVKSVSVDGRTDYEKGEVFKQDTPIVITYHMKEKDDPNKPVETEQEKNEAQTPTSEETIESAESESEYEKAYIRDMKNYDLYYMFDTDTKAVVYFGTNDSFVDRGTYTGDFSTGVTITWSHGEWTEKFTHEGGSYATLTDGNGFDWEYKVCDVGVAQRVLDGLQ